MSAAAVPAKTNYQQQPPGNIGTENRKNTGRAQGEQRNRAAGYPRPPKPRINLDPKQRLLPAAPAWATVASTVLAAIAAEAITATAAAAAEAAAAAHAAPTTA